MFRRLQQVVKHVTVPVVYTDPMATRTAEFAQQTITRNGSNTGRRLPGLSGMGSLRDTADLGVQQNFVAVYQTTTRGSGRPAIGEQGGAGSKTPIDPRGMSPVQFSLLGADVISRGGY